MNTILLALAVSVFFLLALVLLPAALALSLSRPTTTGPLYFEARLGLFWGWCGGGVQHGPQGTQNFIAIGRWRRLLGQASSPPKSSVPEAGDKPASPTTEMESAEKTTADKKTTTQPSSSPKNTWDRLVRLWRLAGAPTTLFIRRLPRVIAWRRCSLAGDLGLGDPALTGRVYGLLAALEAVAPKRLEVDLRPDFSAGSRGACRLHLHLYLYRLLLLLCLFAFRIGGRWLGMRWRRLAGGTALLLFFTLCNTATGAV